MANPEEGERLEDTIAYNVQPDKVEKKFDSAKPDGKQGTKDGTRRWGTSFRDYNQIMDAPENIRNS